MWVKILVCAVMIGSATASQRKRYVDSNGPGRGNYAPDYGFMDPYEFHQKLTQQILSQQNQQNRALTSVFASSDAAAFAEASNIPDYDYELFQEQFAHQQRLFDNLRRQSQGAAYNGGYGDYGGASGSSYSGGGSGSGYSGGSGSGYSGGSRSGSGYGGGSGSGYSGGSGSGKRAGSASGNGGGSGADYSGGSGSGNRAGTGSGSYSGNYAPNYASASGTYGPGGGYQSAAVFPENPSVPNINNRFSEAADNENGGGGGGFRGVSVSSYSSSSDVNGKKTNQRGASTTINDNGKVTTYRVHS